MAIFTLNEVTTRLSDEFVNLSNRLRELNALEDGDPEMMYALYTELANSFEEWHKPILTANARKHAAEWRARI